MCRPSIICLTLVGSVALLLGPGRTACCDEPPPAGLAVEPQTFSVPGKFSIDAPHDGYQWTLHHEDEIQGVKMQWYLYSKTGGQSAVVLGVQEYTADTDQARIDTIRGHYDGTHETLEKGGFTDLKGHPPKMEPPIPDRVPYAIMGKNPAGGDAYTFGLIVFGRSVYTLQTTASSREDARHMYDIANSFKELPAN